MCLPCWIPLHIPEQVGISGDLQYVDLGGSVTTPGPSLSGVKFDAKQVHATIGAEWSVARTPSYDIGVAGVLRYSGLQFQPGILPGVQVSGSDSWLDGMIGLRGCDDLGERTYITGGVLAGAGGSDFTADVMLGLGYRLSDRFCVSLEDPETRRQPELHGCHDRRTHMRPSRSSSSITSSAQPSHAHRQRTMFRLRSEAPLA